MSSVDVYDEYGNIYNLTLFKQLGCWFKGITFSQIIMLVKTFLMSSGQLWLNGGVAPTAEHKIHKVRLDPHLGVVDG